MILVFYTWKCTCEFFTGSKYWKTNKTVRAMSQNLYKKFRGAEMEQPQSELAGPSTNVSLESGNLTLRTLSPVQISDSESDTIVTVTKKRKYVPTPPFELDSSDETKSLSIGKLDEIIVKLDKVIEKHEGTVPRPPFRQLIDIFTCLICAEPITDSSEPLVPPCCRNVMYCHDCLDQWLINNTIVLTVVQHFSALNLVIHSQSFPTF